MLLTFPENKRLREAFYNLCRTALDVIPVFGLFAASILFFGVITLKFVTGKKLVYSNGALYFNDYFDIIWDLYVLTTTANSPDVIIPAYENDRRSMCIYILVCVISNWLFMGIITATVYNAYKTHLGNYVTNTAVRRKKLLNEAFTHVATGNESGIYVIPLSDFIRLMSAAFPGHDISTNVMLFHVLDKDKSGALDEPQFSRLSEYMQLHFEKIRMSRKNFIKLLPACYKIVMSPPFQMIRR
ncbi:unnamed protein product, partial [Protopolystoma xenopodis]